jgi:hypothetical protein
VLVGEKEKALYYSEIATPTFQSQRISIMEEKSYWGWGER